MKNPFDATACWFNLMARSLNRLPEVNWKMIAAAYSQAQAFQSYWNGVLRYTGDFVAPSWSAQGAFGTEEKRKFVRIPPWENAGDFLDLFMFNLQVATRGIAHSLTAMNEYHLNKGNEWMLTWLNTLFGENGDNIAEFWKRQAGLMDLLVNRYPEIIKGIEPEYGFHFENGGYIKTAETDRFILYQVLPSSENIKVRQKGKPVIIVPPYVLGANILAFLPKENKSYVHCFANQGIPTYIRIVKDIDTTPAVQVMSGEEDARDTRYFCEIVKAKHGKQVTLNGFCQGGFMTLCAILSGEVDGLVDAHITCASPMDGTRSKSLVEYLKHIPERFRDVGYSLKRLPNGNRVVDGKIMSWVFKLKSVESEAPLVTFYRDLKMFDRFNGSRIRVSNTAAAINYWLVHDQTDLPPKITRMSFDSYTIPVSKDGTLPVKLFGRDLNFKHMKELGIQWLICIADKDDLVDRESALAPLDFMDAEVTVFPKGHASIATSWSIPTSECALHLRFADRSGKVHYRGPVYFQMELEESGKPALRVIHEAEGTPE